MAMAPEQTGIGIRRHFTSEGTHPYDEVTWELRDARARGVPHLALLPCLGLTFMLGPVGLLLYFVLRGVLGRPPAAA